MLKTIDTNQIVFPKNKCSDKKSPDDEWFQYVSTESDQKYPLDLTGDDKIFVEYGKDHTFKPDFENVKISIERISKLIPLIFKEDL